MQDSDFQPAFDFLAKDNHEGVIFGALKHLGVTRQCHYFDDLVQEGRLIFVQGYLDYDGDITADEHKFMGLMYKKIYWRLIDILRRQSNQNEHHEFSLDNELIPTEIIEEVTLDSNSSDSPLDQLVSNDFFMRLFDICSANERKFLIGAVLKQKTATEIALRYGVTKQAVSKWKKQVQAKAKLIEVERENRR